jgi:hypothetical protein
VFFPCNLLPPSRTILLLLPTLLEHLLVTPARITYPPITRLPFQYLPQCHVFVRVIMFAAVSRSLFVIPMSHRQNLLQHRLITVFISCPTSSSPSKFPYPSSYREKCLVSSKNSHNKIR